MLNWRNKISYKIISLALTQAFLLTGIIYPEPVNRTLSKTNNKSNISYIKKLFSIYIPALLPDRGTIRHDESLRVKMIFSKDGDQGRKQKAIDTVTEGDVALHSYFPGYEYLSVREVLIEAEEAFNKGNWKLSMGLYLDALYGISDKARPGLTRIATEFNPQLRTMAISHIKIAYKRIQVCREKLGVKVARFTEGIDIEKVMHINFEPIILPNGEPIIFSGDVTKLSELHKAFFVFIKQFHENFWYKFEPYLKMSDEQSKKEIEKVNRYSTEAYFIQLLRLLLNNLELKELLFKALFSARSNGVFGIKNEKARNLEELGYKQDWMILAELLFYYFIYSRYVDLLSPEEELLCKEMDTLIDNTTGYGRSFHMDLNLILLYQLREAKILPYRGPYNPLSMGIFREFGYNLNDPLKIIFDLYRYYTPPSNQLQDTKIASLSHIFSVLNGIFYGSGSKKLEEFFSKTTVGYDPQTAYANAQEFYQYLCELDRSTDLNKKVPRSFCVEEWGIGNGNFAKHFLDKLHALDKENKTDYYSRLQYVLVDFSEPMLQNAQDILQEHGENIIIEKCNLSKDLPQKRENILLIRFNELYDDLPGVDIIEKKRGRYYRLYLEPVIFVSNDSESSDLDGFIQVKKIDGTLISLDEFVRNYISNEGVSIEDLDFDSLRPYLGKVKFRQKLVEIDIEYYPEAGFVKEFFKDREEGRLPINFGAYQNLIGALGLLDVRRQGYIDFFDYGFSDEIYKNLLKEGLRGKPLLEITPKGEYYNSMVHWDEQPTVLLNYPWFVYKLRNETGIQFFSENQIKYLERIHKEHFAPIAVLIPIKPINQYLLDRYEEEDLGEFFSSMETHVDYLPGFDEVRNKEKILHILKKFSKEWQEEKNIKNREETWIRFLEDLEREVYENQLPQEMREGVSYIKDTIKHSVFDIGNIKDAFELSFRILADKELSNLYRKKHESNTVWVTEEEVRNLPLIRQFFTEQAVEEFINVIWKNIDTWIYRFIHFQIKVGAMKGNGADIIETRIFPKRRSI